MNLRCVDDGAAVDVARWHPMRLRSLGRCLPLLLPVLLVGPIDVGVSGVVRPAAADIGVGVPGCAVDPADLLGWWTGTDNLSAAIGPDLTGSTAFGEALFGRGFDLGPTTDLEAAALGTVSTGLTVEMWLKPLDPAIDPGIGRVQVLASRWEEPSSAPDADAARSFMLYLSPPSTLVLATDDPSTRRPVELRFDAPSLYDGDWHHVAATFSQSATTLYVDGYPEQVGPSVGALSPATRVPFRLGSKSGLGDPFRFRGLIDEPSVAKVALTAVQIDSLVAAGPNGKCTNLPAP